MEQPLTIIGLRAEMNLPQGEFARLIGLSSVGHMSLIERENRCSLAVALRIEEVSGGRLDAADLNDDVRAAREACRHGCADNPGDPDASAGKGEEDSPCIETEQPEIQPNTVPVGSRQETAGAGIVAAPAPADDACASQQGKAA